VAHTLTEKILLEHSDVDDVTPGDIVTVRCDIVMANDISGPMAFRTMKEMGVERVFDPSKVVVAGGDSHTCTHGALGAFGTGLGSTDVASCLAYGTFWQVVPGTLQIELTGRLRP